MESHEFFFKSNNCSQNFIIKKKPPQRGDSNSIIQQKWKALYLISQVVASKNNFRKSPSPFFSLTFFI